MAISTSITNGIKAIKIAKVDAFGNNNTLSLQELDTLVIEFSDLGRVNFTVTSISEYPNYYLYYVVVKEIGYQNSTFTLPTVGAPISASSLQIGPYPTSSTSIGGFSGSNNLSPYSYNNPTGIFTSPSWSVAYTDVMNFTCSVYSNITASFGLVVSIS